MELRDHIFSIGIGLAIKYDQDSAYRDKQERRLTLVKQLIEELYGEDFIEISTHFSHSQSMVSYAKEHPELNLDEKVISLQNYKKLETKHLYP